MTRLPRSTASGPRWAAGIALAIAALAAGCATPGSRVDAQGPAASGYRVFRGEDGLRRCPDPRPSPRGLTDQPRLVWYRAPLAAEVSPACRAASEPLDEEACAPGVAGGSLGFGPTAAGGRGWGATGAFPNCRRFSGPGQPTDRDRRTH